jgi:RHS repeat-associated protein
VDEAREASRAFDRFGRLEEIRWRNTTSGAGVDHLLYGYDRASLRQWRDVEAPAGVMEDELFAYDGLYQVTQRQRGVLNTARTAMAGTPERQEDFDFDPLGNWEAYTLRANGTVQADQSHTRGHNQANQITAINGAAARVAHDFAGNMTKSAPDKTGDWSKGYTLKWDAWSRGDWRESRPTAPQRSPKGGRAERRRSRQHSRLVEVRNQHDSALVAVYQYDGIFRRTISTTGGTARHFFYDHAWRILEERPGNASGAPDRLYTWGLRHRTDMVCRDARPVTPPAGSSSSSDSGTGSASVRHYVSYDWISPIAIIDASTGTVQERYSYSAFGQRRIMDAAFATRTESAHAWNFSFHGQFEDPETGWMNYGFRSLDVRMGRWLRRDPIWEQGGINLFRFVKNKPGNVTDHLGMDDVRIDGGHVSYHEEGWFGRDIGNTQYIGTLDSSKKNVDLAKPMADYLGANSVPLKDVNDVQHEDTIEEFKKALRKKTSFGLSEAKATCKELRELRDAIAQGTEALEKMSNGQYGSVSQMLEAEGLGIAGLMGMGPTERAKAGLPAGQNALIKVLEKSKEFNRQPGARPTASSASNPTGWAAQAQARSKLESEAIERELRARKCCETEESP